MLKAAPQIPPGMCLHLEATRTRPASVDVKATAIPKPATRTWTEIKTNDSFDDSIIIDAGILTQHIGDNIIKIIVACDF